MFTKTLFVLYVGFSVVFTENNKMDELNNLMKKIDDQIHDIASNAAFVLRPLQVAVQYYTNEANKAFIDNLTVAAKPYWSSVAGARKHGIENSQNNDHCIDSINSELYTTNNTFADRARQSIQVELDIGQKLIADTYDIAQNNPVKKLGQMHQRVRDCKEEACAVQLQEELQKEYREISSAAKASLDKVDNYVNKEFQKKVDVYTTVPKEYIDKIHQLIYSLELCIRK